MKFFNFKNDYNRTYADLAVLPNKVDVTIVNPPAPSSKPINTRAFMRS